MAAPHHQELIQNELSELCYYHGLLESSKAVKLLRREKPGTFLLRTSPNPSRKGAFTISVIKNRTASRTDIYHFVVLGAPGRYYASANAPFARIADLVDHYKTHDYENHLDIPSVRLTHPLRSAAYVSPYSYARVGDRLEQLLHHLTQLDETTNEERCECGILMRDAELPDGWMLHQTPAQKGGKPRIFFQHNRLNLTQWDPPAGLFAKLTVEQKEFIKARLPDM